jgi:hypothetical protein
MASIHKQSGRPNWFCAYYDPESFRRFQSTGTENAKVARIICAAVERASKLARENKLSNEKGLKLIRETCNVIEEGFGKLAANRAQKKLQGFVESFIKIAGGELTTYSIRSWLTTWMEGRTDARESTRADYQRVIKSFLIYMGTRADRALTTLQPKQVEEFKTQLMNRYSPSTINKTIKILKASFTNAVAKRQLEFSPAEHVEYMQVEEGNRRPFTPEELKQILNAANQEWQTMILVAFYTGLRLGDCANMTWQNVELHKGNISVMTEKTKRRQLLPIAEPLSRHLQKLSGDNPHAPLSPS